jgi:formimidoylglutamate deiminase
LSGYAEQVAWLPELAYVGGRFGRDLAVVTDGRTGRVVSLLPLEQLRRAAGGGEPREGETYDISISDRYAPVRFVRLPGRALLPGMVNAHSHAFQRAIRGRTEFRTSSRDTFWTWREMMYRAAERLSPEDLYDASRMAFLEMALSGITSVGEFHYLHHNPDGTPYDDPNLLAKQVVSAARDVGVRIALLRVAYARAGFQVEANPRQSRFITRDADTFIKHLDALANDLAREYGARDGGAGAAGAERGATAAAGAWAGVAPHSVRAVPLPYLREVCAHARERQIVAHMHVAEQPAENEACLAEHGRTPVRLLADENLLDERFTAVHAVHITAEEAHALSRANVCACPTTERNLGDGVVPADLLFDAGVSVALGTDSHAQIDLLEDARELEYHLRLQKLSRAVLAPLQGADGDAREIAGSRQHDNAARSEGDHAHSQTSALAARLFGCATAGVSTPPSRRSTSIS